MPSHISQVLTFHYQRQWLLKTKTNVTSKAWGFLILYSAAIFTIEHIDQEAVLNGNLRHQRSEVCLGPHPPAYMHCMLRISFFVRTSFHGINPPIRTKCNLALQIKTINCKAYWMRIDQQLTTTANISWCLHFYWFPCEMISWKRAQKLHTDDPRGGEGGLCIWNGKGCSSSQLGL